MSDASVEIQATNLFALGANFKIQSSNTDEPSTNPNAMDEVGNVSCERIITDMTTYTMNAKYCGSDFLGDLVDTSAAPVPFLENIGCTFDSKLLDSLTINMTAADYCTVDFAGHNHAVNAHDGGATPTGATRADALALGIFDGSDFMPHEVAEAFNGWDGFGVPDFGIAIGADSSPSSATVTFSFGAHNDQIDESGDHLVGKSITPKCELTMDFAGVPTSNTKALLNIDFAANTNSMLGAVTDSVADSDGNTEFDTFSLVGHAFTDLATV
jgi:hypothetical protein